jgi:pimeloyl-ACP methyl ester carboxylesterase
MSTPHPHQTVPLVYINGRSGLFAGDCSSHATTRVLMLHMEHSHFYRRQYHITYPPSRAWQAYSTAWRRRTGNLIATQIRDYARLAPEGLVDVFAHSMGALLFWYAARDLDCIRRVILAAPAMDSRIDWDLHNFESMHVFINPADRALMWGSLLPWHPYGNAGRFGFRVNDSRIHNITLTDWGRSDPHRHSHYFREPSIHETGYEVDRILTS